jgi:hypothetical protein
MSTVRPKSNDGKDFGPSRVFGIDLDIPTKFQFILGECDTKDGRFRSFIPAKMRRVDIDVVDMSKVGRELDDYPAISSHLYWDIPIERRVMSP